MEEQRATWEMDEEPVAQHRNAALPGAGHGVPAATALDPSARLPQVAPIIDLGRLHALQRYMQSSAMPGEVKHAIVEITGSAVQARSKPMRHQVGDDRLDIRCDDGCMRGAHALRN